MRDFLLGSHFTDSAKLARCNNVDQFNVRHFDDEVEIECRLVRKTTILKSALDETILSTTTIYTFENVNDLDQINGKDIVAIYEWKSLLDHTIVGYKVLI